MRSGRPIVAGKLRPQMIFFVVGMCAKLPQKARNFHWKSIPPKINMEPEKGLEKEKHLQIINLLGFYPPFPLEGIRYRIVSSEDGSS